MLNDLSDFQMSRASPQMRNFAKRLIVYESGGNNSSEKNASGVFPWVRSCVRRWRD
jgi:hypothetical protein